MYLSVSESRQQDPLDWSNLSRSKTAAKDRKNLFLTPESVLNCVGAPNRPYLISASPTDYVITARP